MRAIALLLATSTAAFAHGPAEWIQREGYRNEVGELCCGERDCQIVYARYDAPARGYRVDDPRFAVGKFVPENRTQPSPNGQFWSCAWGGAIKCFFAPMPSTWLLRKPGDTV